MQQSPTNKGDADSGTGRLSAPDQADPLQADDSRCKVSEPKNAKQSAKQPAENIRTESAERDQQTENPALPADLQQIVDAWPHLPEPIRKAMMAMVESSR